MTDYMRLAFTQELEKLAQARSSTAPISRVQVDAKEKPKPAAQGMPNPMPPAMPKPTMKPPGTRGAPTGMAMPKPRRAPSPLEMPRSPRMKPRSLMERPSIAPKPKQDDPEAFVADEVKKL